MVPDNRKNAQWEVYSLAQLRNESSSANIVNVDFLNDWKQHMISEMSSLGYRVDPSSEVETIGLQFFSLALRRVVPQPRVVFQSQEFQCPADHQMGLGELMRKAISGEDLNPHYSRKLRDPDYDDSLLNDWGIYHFHLGTTIESDGFVKRTGPVAFAMVSATHLYLIDVRVHGHGAPAPWAKQDLLEIVNSNWPYLLDPYRLKGVADIEPVTEDARLELRKHNVVAFTSLSDESFLVPPGGGYATDGTNIEIVRQNDKVMMLISKCEEFVRSEISTIRNQFESAGVPFQGPEYSFRLEFDPPKILCRELRHDVTFHIANLA